MPVTNSNTQSTPDCATPLCDSAKPLHSEGQGDAPTWSDGSPPDSVEVAWLRVEAYHPDCDLVYVVLGCRSLEDGQWCIAADWKGESHHDPVEDFIVHWMPYSIPSVRLIGQAKGTTSA